MLEFFSDEPFPADAELLELLLSVGTQLGRVVERQRSEEARLRALIDNMPASVYLRDLDGRFILVNRAVRGVLGAAPRRDPGQDALRDPTRWRSSIVSPERQRAGRPRGAGGAASRADARRTSSARGKEHVLADVRFPVLDGSGEIVAVAGIDIDITAQKRSEAELAELLRRVEMARDAAMEAASAKSRFLASMSHELRTPLNAIIGFTRLVSRNAEALPERAGRQPLQDPRQRRAPARADRRDPRSLADRGGRGRASTSPRRTSRTCCGRSPIRSSRSSTGRACSWSSRSTPGLPPVVTDRDKLKQILLNLLSNAIKYTDEGSIAVRAGAADGRLRVARLRHRRRHPRRRARPDLRRVPPRRRDRRPAASRHRSRPDDLAPARAGARRRHHRREPARRADRRSRSTCRSIYEQRAAETAIGSSA